MKQQRVIGLLRLLRILLVLAGLFACVLVGAGYGLVFTTAGARWLAERVQAVEPRLTLEVSAGRLWNGVDLQGIRWTDEGLDVSIRKLHLRWDMRQLHRRQVRVMALHVDGVHLVVAEREPPAEPVEWKRQLDPNQRTSLSLPELQLPVALFLSDVRITDLRIEGGEQVSLVKSLSLRAEISDRRLMIRKAVVTHANFRAEGAGRMLLEGDYPLDLRIAVDMPDAFGGAPLSARLKLSDRLADCRLILGLDGSLDLQLEGRIAPLDRSLPVDLLLTWRNLGWPLADEPRLLSHEGTLTLAGSLESYELMAGFDLEGASGITSRWEVLLSGDWQHAILHSLSGVLPEGSIALQGRLGWGEAEKAFRGRLEAEVPDLGFWLPEGHGRLSLDLEADGSLPQSRIALNLRGKALGWGDQGHVDRLNITANVIDLGHAASSLRLSAEGMHQPGRSLDLGDFLLTLEGNRSLHCLDIMLDEGPLRIASQVEGSLDEQLAWHAQWTSAILGAGDFEWALESPVSLAWCSAHRQATIEQHHWHHRQSRVVFQEPLLLGPAGRVRLSVERLDLADLAPWFPPEARLTGRLDSDLHADWSTMEPLTGDLKIAVHEGQIHLLDPDWAEDSTSLPVDTLTLVAALKPDGAQGGMELRAAGLGQASVEGSLVREPDGGFDSVAGVLEVSNLDLDFLRTFLLMFRKLEGRINASVDLQGTLQDPHLSGHLAWSDGLVEPAALPVTLSGIDLGVNLDGRHGTLEGGFRSGAGQAALQGTADWSGKDIVGKLRLSGEDLELMYDTLATLKVSPDLTLSMKDGTTRLRGMIKVPQADISIQQLPETAVRLSPDVIVVDDEEQHEPETVPAGSPMEMALTLALGDQVRISGYGLQARLEGSLDLRQATGEAPRILGTIRIVDGRYRAYGQRLTIRSGRFIFAGPLQAPDIEIEAVRAVPAYNIVAGMRLEGNPEHPRITLFSEPPLPEEEILSFLLLGRPLQGADASGVSLLARAAVALGVAGGARGLSWAEGLGVEELQLDTAGEGAATQVVVSGRVGPRLYLSYGAGVFSSISRIQMRYRLTHRLFLQAVSSAEDSLDLFYEFSF